jgi:enoyl-CoA hydratase/carnithine racemase
VRLDYVTLEKKDGIAIVPFDRKANLNAFNEKLVVELAHAARSFQSRVTVSYRTASAAREAFWKQ